MMSTHAKFSASSRHRWSRCSASIKMEAKYPEKSTNAALDGTRTHWVLEQVLLSNPLMVVGQSFTDEHGTYVLDKERFERVMFAVNYVKAQGGTVTTERYFSLEQVVVGHDCGGTVDVIIQNTDTLEIIDYKDGVREVEVENNKQLEVYLVGVLSKLDKRFEKIKLTIIQPKLQMFEKPGISSWVVDYFEVDKIVQSIKKEIDDVNTNPTFAPGALQCDYCKAKIHCEAFIEHGLAVAGIKFDNLAETAANQDPKKFDDKFLVRLVESASLIKGLVEAAEEEALRRLEAGQTIEGLKLVHGRGSSAWNADDKVIAAKLKKMKVPKDQIYKQSLVTVAQLKNINWVNKDQSVGQLTEGQIDLLKKSYVTTSKGKLSVVPVADKRAAVVIDAAPMFQQVLPSWLS